jgi:exodeoxyribonuclease V alpha subunit
MIDLALMAQTLSALPPHARLILLGDKDQLASVEAGAVLGELCKRAQDGHYNADTSSWLATCTGETVPVRLQDADGLPLDQAVAMLRTSHRFGADSAIGRLAAAVHAGDSSAAIALFQSGLSDLKRITVSDQDPAKDPALRGLALDLAHDSPASVLRYLKSTRPGELAPRADWDNWALAALGSLAKFQLLCALREGPWGVVNMNVVIEAWLRSTGALSVRSESGVWYAGRPVLVTRNDSNIGLMNGDVGLSLLIPARFNTLGQPDPAAGMALRVAFVGERGSVRWLSAARLPPVETVWAMTVHKSQGSEFDHVALLLPDRMAQVLTRELIYTGLTRARKRFTLVGTTNLGTVFSQTLARKVLRSGGTLWPETIFNINSVSDNNNDSNSDDNSKSS